MRLNLTKIFIDCDKNKFYFKNVSGILLFLFTGDNKPIEMLF